MRRRYHSVQRGWCQSFFYGESSIKYRKGANDTCDPGKVTAAPGSQKRNEMIPEHDHAIISLTRRLYWLILQSEAYVLAQYGHP